MLSIEGGRFVRDGHDHKIVSGALHYPRVHPDQWADRLRRLRLLGCNTVETYVAWNFHAPAPGTTDFTGPRDLGRFLDLAAEADLDVIVRPGPYICAEWEGGGFPGWLLADERIRLRCMDPAYLAAVDAWFDELIPIIAARQDSGRVVLVQVENEYGSFGDDKEYLAHLRDGLVRRGITVPLVTSDGPTLVFLQGGTVDGVMPTINFGSRTLQYLDPFRAEFPDAAPMCMEFWHGWFDHWGDQHHSRPADEVVPELEAMLGNGMSVNLYMGHGGTNFGLWNGCNHDGTALQPTITSYDYDAPVAENGALTEKFHAFREVFARQVAVPELPDDLVAAPPTLPPGELSETASTALSCDDLQALSLSAVARLPWHRAQHDPTPWPPAFEDLGLERGMLLYRAEVAHPGGTVNLRLHDLRDRAHVFVNGKLLGILQRDGETTLPVTAERGTLALDLLVESQGRINFGPLLGERKGILRGAWFGTRYVMGWRAYPLPLDLMGEELRALTGRDSASDADGLSLRRFALPVADEHAGRDAFLDTSALTRGFAFVGDDMLGRYWRVGPQQTLYVPGPLLTAGDHVVTVLATDGPGGALALSDHPILDQTQEIPS